MPLYYTADSTCDVCFEYFDDTGSTAPDLEALPSVINCGHVFCRKCLYSVRAPRSNTQEAACPQCRMKFKFEDVRRVHVDQAPKTGGNSRAASILEMAAKGPGPIPATSKATWNAYLRHEKRKGHTEHLARGPAESDDLYQARCLMRVTADRTVYDDRASTQLKHMVWRMRDMLAVMDGGVANTPLEEHYVRTVQALASLAEENLDKTAQTQHFAIDLLAHEREVKRLKWLREMFTDKIGQLQLETGHRDKWDDATRAEYLAVWEKEGKRRLAHAPPADALLSSDNPGQNAMRMRGAAPAFHITQTEGLLLYPQHPEFGLEATRAPRPQPSTSTAPAPAQRAPAPAPAHGLPQRPRDPPPYDLTSRVRRMSIDSGAPAPVIPHGMPSGLAFPQRAPQPPAHEQLATRARRMSIDGGAAAPPPRRTRADSAAQPARRARIANESPVDIQAALRNNGPRHPYRRPARPGA